MTISFSTSNAGHKPHLEPPHQEVRTESTKVHLGLHYTVPALPSAAVPTKSHRPELTLPVRVGFILNTFSFGGSETETIELVAGADPALLRFTGIAVANPLPLPIGEPPSDGSFPCLYMSRNAYVDESDVRVRIVSDFREAVNIVAAASDIIITWGLTQFQEALPPGKIPKIVILSKDSGEWAKAFLCTNSLVTRYLVGNSTLAAHTFPQWAQKSVKVIYDGINPARIAPHLGRHEQRRVWNLGPNDKIAGYLGRIENDKGVDKTVEGVARLPADWKAVFVGVNSNSRHAQELKQHCEQAIPGRYRLLDWCHDVGSALAAFDVFSHPSEHEGFSNSIAEAWLAGVPTIYTRNTGAIPDLGELGISVTPEANGEEMAAALQRAYRNQELVVKARQVVESAFLIHHNVKRWTDYLLQVAGDSRRPRLLALCPIDFVSVLPTWLHAIVSHAGNVDLCCLAIEGVPHPFRESADNEVCRLCRCPTFYVSDSADVAKLICYVRPDAILTFPAPSLPRLIRPAPGVQLVIGINPSADDWLCRLSSLEA